MKRALALSLFLPLCAQAGDVTPKVMPPAAMSAPPPRSCVDFYKGPPVDLSGSGGTSIVVVTIVGGEVTHAALAQSSGNDGLDQAAIACVRTWHFNGADQAGRAIQIRATARVGWKTLLAPAK